MLSIIATNSLPQLHRSTTENLEQEPLDEYDPPTLNPTFPDNQSVERETDIELFPAVPAYVS